MASSRSLAARALMPYGENSYKLVASKRRRMGLSARGRSPDHPVESFRESSDVPARATQRVAPTGDTGAAVDLRGVKRDRGCVSVFRPALRGGDSLAGFRANADACSSDEGTGSGKAVLRGEREPGTAVRVEHARFTPLSGRGVATVGRHASVALSMKAGPKFCVNMRAHGVFRN